jgi:hypothetical protein
VLLRGRNRHLGLAWLEALVKAWPPEVALRPGTHAFQPRRADWLPRRWVAALRRPRAHPIPLPAALQSVAASALRRLALLDVQGAPATRKVARQRARACKAAAMLDAVQKLAARQLWFCGVVACPVQEVLVVRRGVQLVLPKRKRVQAGGRKWHRRTRRRPLGNGRRGGCRRRRRRSGLHVGPRGLARQLLGLGRADTALAIPRQLYFKVNLQL